MNSRLIALVATMAATINTYSQKNYARYFDEVIFTDTASTMFFPIRYNDELLSNNKVAFWGDYYANILVYNYTKDVYQKLFSSDCYIQSLTANYYSTAIHDKLAANRAKEWIFLFVRQYDTNDNGRIDEKDPAILYAVTTRGEKLRALTDKNENAVSIQMFEKQGFALLKIQRDSDQDGSFKMEDKEIYYRKIDLKDLSLGNPVELKQGL